LSLFATVVVDFDSEDYHRADGSDYIGYDQRPIAEGNTLNDKEYTAKTKHTERRERDTIGIAGLYSHDSLRHIAEYHTQTGRITNNCNEKITHK